MNAIISKNITNTTNISNERLDYYWEKIIPYLLTENWEAFEIQLAWDFVTASRKSMLGVPELIMRMTITITHSLLTPSEDMIDSAVPKYDIIKVDQETCSTESKQSFKGRTVWGTVHVPNYLSSGRGSVLEASLQPEPVKEVKSNGIVKHPFLLRWVENDDGALPSSGFRVL
jgi:hypothetical protein